VTLELLVSFLIASVVLTISPGPDILYVITSSSARGFKTGFTIALGLCSGLIIHASIVAFGAAQFIQTTPWVFMVIKLFGFAYLIYLAILVFRSTHYVEVKIGEFSDQNLTRFYLRGFLMNVLNPKVTLFFLAFLPQFIPNSTSSPILDAYVLSAIFFMQALVIFSLAAYFSNKVLGFIRQSDRGLLLLKWAQIVIFTALAIGILTA
jgi:threonine/homoserine/homoserine lactone efflux protein